MTCEELGGACSQSFRAETFDELAMMLSKHAREQVQKGDMDHINAMNEMRKNMASPDSMKTWMGEKRKVFDALPED